MKKLMMSALLLMTVVAGLAQSEKYTNAMKEKVAAVDTTFSAPALIDLSAAFERIAEAEKTQWLPYYYASLTQIKSGYMSAMGGASNTASLDAVTDKAEVLLGKAEALSKDNSEIYLVKKMIATLRLSADPVNRFMKYGPVAQEALETAKKLNAENPRVYLLEGQDKYYTPEQYGGSKEKAKELFNEALKKFETFKPATDLDPSWGKSTAEHFLGMYK